MEAVQNVELVQPADVYVHSQSPSILKVCRLSDHYRFFVITDRFENIINEFPGVDLVCTVQQFIENLKTLIDYRFLINIDFL